MLINGVLKNGVGFLDVIDPSLGQVVERVPLAGKADVSEAVAGAQRAFPGWAGLSVAERAAFLSKFRDAICARREELIAAVAIELGRDCNAISYEADVCALFFDETLRLNLEPELVEYSEARRAVLHRRPLGVVAAIGSWNAPVIVFGSKVVPALLAGNTVVFKPSPYTPLSALVIGWIAREILPPGVLNIVIGDDAAGRLLTSHPAVRKITFTGSTDTGRAVAAAAAPSLKRMTLELGGHNPGILLADCDPHAIADRLCAAAFFAAGQICTSLRRLYIPRAIYDDAREALIAASRSYEIPPIQNRAQLDRIAMLVDDARRQGAMIAIGGSAPYAGGGYRFPPTILENVPDTARIRSQECFGPVLQLFRYDDLDAAIAEANDSEFGLGASVWGRDSEILSDVARRLDAGSIWINAHADVRPNLPLAPAKQSGMGVEYGMRGLDEFCQFTLINEALV